MLTFVGNLVCFGIGHLVGRFLRSRFRFINYSCHLISVGISFLLWAAGAYFLGIPLWFLEGYVRDGVTATVDMGTDSGPVLIFAGLLGQIASKYFASRQARR